MVAKLFAKHIKLSESIDLCRSTRYGGKYIRISTMNADPSRIGLGVGTPARLLALILDGTLNLPAVASLVAIWLTGI
jgi:hypothetical protein